MKTELQKAYLDWFNNYITVAAFAEGYGLTVEQSQQLIDLGKSVHEGIVTGNQ